MRTVSDPAGRYDAGVLVIDPQTPVDRPARLRAYVWGGPGMDHAVHRRDDGRACFVRTHVEGDRRTLRQWLADPAGFRPLDDTVFRLAPDFAEVERRRARGGPNLHATPIVLPASLTVGVPVVVGPGATVTAAWHGFVRLRLGDHEEGGNALRLDARTGETTRSQWLLEGVGEIAVGDGPGRWFRWLEAWTGGATTRFGGVPEGWLRAELPDLPERADTPAAGLL